MEKVDFVLKNGRIERMHPKIAELLQRKGKGTYQTRVVEQAPQQAVLVPEPPVVHDVREEPVDHEPQNEPEVSRESVESSAALTPEPPVDLTSMSVEELREHAKRQGVQVHHRAGAATILQALSK